MKKLFIGILLFLGSSAFADCGTCCNSCACGKFVDGAIYSEDTCPQIHCLPDAEVIEVPACPPPAPVVVCPAPKPAPKPAPCGCPSSR